MASATATAFVSGSGQQKQQMFIVVFNFIVPCSLFCLLLLFASANAEKKGHSPSAASSGQQQQQPSNNNQQIIVHYGNRSFDITPFVPHHPGGPLVLQHVNGKDVAEYLAGRQHVILPEFGGAVVQHEHGPAAFHVLNSFEIKENGKAGGGGGRGGKH